MKRTDFELDITTWSELKDFCYDMDCPTCDDVYSEDDRDDYLDESLVSMARDAGNWRELLRTLEDIPTGFDYYIKGDYDESWVYADDCDFDNYKGYVLEWGDENGIWDDEEEEPNEDAAYEERTEENMTNSTEPQEPEEPASPDELFTTCTSEALTIRGRYERDKAEAQKTEDLQKKPGGNQFAEGTRGRHIGFPVVLTERSSQYGFK